MTEEYTLNVARVREVNLPTKSYNAAGYDFYIPTDLHISDFTKNYEIYCNNFIEPAYEQGLAFSTSKFILTDDSIFIEIQFASKDEGNTFLYKVGKSNNGYPFKSGAEVVAWCESPSTRVAAIEIAPGGKVLIPSGIKANLPDSVYLKAENKSGISSKRGLIFGASVVDQDYMGEIHICLINPTSTPAKIVPGEKVIQFLPCFSPKMSSVSEYSEDLLFEKKKSERGANGFGSTDTFKANEDPTQMSSMNTGTNMMNTVPVKNGRGRPKKKID